MKLSHFYDSPRDLIKDIKRQYFIKDVQIKTTYNSWYIFRGISPDFDNPSSRRYCISPLAWNLFLLLFLFMSFIKLNQYIYF